MINELVHQSITNYRTHAYLSGLAVDTGELTNQEINSYIVFILAALEKRNKEVAPWIPISRKVKESNEYLEIEAPLKDKNIDENTDENTDENIDENIDEDAIDNQLKTLIRTSTNHFQSLNTRMKAETKKRRDEMQGAPKSIRYTKPVEVYDFQKEYDVLMGIKGMGKSSLKTTYNKILQNHLKNISFKSYQEFVAFLKQDAEHYEDEDLQYISLYLIEKNLNFETLN